MGGTSGTGARVRLFNSGPTRTTSYRSIAFQAGLRQSDMSKWHLIMRQGLRRQPWPSGPAPRQSQSQSRLDLRPIERSGGRGGVASDRMAQTGPS